MRPAMAVRKVRRRSPRHRWQRCSLWHEVWRTTSPLDLEAASRRTHGLLPPFASTARGGIGCRRIQSDGSSAAATTATATTIKVQARHAVSKPDSYRTSSLPRSDRFLVLDACPRGRVGRLLEKRGYNHRSVATRAPQGCPGRGGATTDRPVCYRHIFQSRNALLAP